MTFVLIYLLLFPLQVIFITEYMSSGSLKQFLKKTKKNHKTMNEKVWKFADKSKAADTRNLFSVLGSKEKRHLF